MKTMKQDGCAKKGNAKQLEGGTFTDGGAAPSKKGEKSAAQSHNRFRVVLIEPEYELNVGAVARAMKNFGFAQLVLVRPKCNHLGFDAIKYSKHAREVLECARVVRSLSSATKGCKFTVGTTGILYRHWHKTFRTPISLKELANKIKGQKEGEFAIVFGNEGVGLSERDISDCDFLITIPANKEYPILNLSHAVAIVLYELSGYALLGFTPAGEKEKEALVRTFSLIVGHYSGALRNAKKVKVAFRRMAGKSMLTDKECASILGVLRRAERDLGRKK